MKEMWSKVYVGLHVVLSHFNETGIFLTYFLKILKYKISSPFSGSWVVPCGWTDRRTDITKLIIVAFWNFSHTPKARFEVFTRLLLNMQVFWDVMLYQLVNIYHSAQCHIPEYLIFICCCFHVILCLISGNYLQRNIPITRHLLSPTLNKQWA